jgi:MoaA/NifB/PqqE/SkfB family radical SAM enzyme
MGPHGHRIACGGGFDGEAPEYFLHIQPHLAFRKATSDSIFHSRSTRLTEEIPMSAGLAKWKLSPIRSKMAAYRRAQGDYYLKGKPIVTLENGSRVFSLLAPALGSPAARRRIRLVMDNMSALDVLTKREKTLPSAARTPHVTTLAITYDCQCSCLHCSATHSQEEVRRNQSAMAYEELKDAICQTVDLGCTCVVLTGGEPLLYDRIFDLIGAVDKRRSVCTIFTNGAYLVESSVDNLKRTGVFGVFVSLDHSNPDQHDANRGQPGLFDQATHGLARCQLAGIPTGISTYATKEKIRSGELDAMMDLAKTLNVLEVFIFDVIPTGRLSDQRECILDENDVHALHEFRSKYNCMPDYPRIIHQTMFSSMAYPCVAEGCPAGMVTAHIRANGDVCPCDFTPHSFGNLRQKSLSEIWQSMIGNKLYAKPSVRCRLSQPDFWDKLDELQSVT